MPKKGRSFYRSHEGYEGEEDEGPLDLSGEVEGLLAQDSNTGEEISRILKAFGGGSGQNDEKGLRSEAARRLLRGTDNQP